MCKANKIFGKQSVSQSQSLTPEPSVNEKSLKSRSYQEIIPSEEPKNKSAISEQIHNKQMSAKSASWQMECTSQNIFEDDPGIQEEIKEDDEAEKEKEEEQSDKGQGSSSQYSQVF